MYRHYNTYFPCVAKWRKKKRAPAPVVEKVTSEEDALENTKYSALSPQPSSAGIYSKSSKLAVNKRAAHLLSRADTALTPSEDGSSAPLYGGNGNYGASIGSGTGNYAPGTSNYGGSVGGQSAYTAYSAVGSSGVGSGNALPRGNAPATSVSISPSPNRSKAPSLSNLVSKAPPPPLLPPPAKDDADDDNYEQQQSSVRESALEENPYEDPDKRRSSAGNKQGSFASAANSSKAAKRKSDDDYVDPNTLAKSPERPAAGRSGGLNSSQHSLHALPPPPPIPSSTPLRAPAATSAAERSATSPTPANKSQPQARGKSVNSELIDMARLGPAPPPPTQTTQKI